MDYKIQEKSFSNDFGRFSASYVIRGNKNILIEIIFSILLLHKHLPIRLFCLNTLTVKYNGKEYHNELTEYDVFTKKDILKTIKNNFNKEENHAIINVINGFYKKINLIKKIGL